MGMVACFVAVSAPTLERLREEEDAIADFLYPDDVDSEPPNYIDLDKAWHGIHYLLTGEAEGGREPLSLAVQGGVEFGPEIGYGSARFLLPAQVAVIAAALNSLPAAALKTKFNPQDMRAKEIYPDIIWLRDGANALEYLLENYQQLVAFYREAAARRDAVIQWLS